MIDKAHECSTLIARHLKEHNWHYAKCPSCGNGMYTKYVVDESVHCGRRECVQDPLHFLSLTKRKRLVHPHDVHSRLHAYFKQRGFTHAISVPVGRQEGVTDLVVAGVQRYDGVLHTDQSVTHEQCFVAQPSVRMQFLDMVGKVNGVVSSFVNICTEHTQATPTDHVESLDHWLGAVSRLGLHMNDLMLISRTKVQDWGTGSFLSYDVFYMYGGLELGDASYSVIPRAHGGAVAISDVGFGLERIAWALNKTSSYLDLLRPFSVGGTERMHDLYRTLTLLALSNISPGPKGAGLQFRRLAKQLVDGYASQYLDLLVPYYVGYWKPFLSELSEHATCAIRLEVDRFRNLELQREHSWPPPRNETTEEYLARMVYSSGIDPCTVRKLLSS